MAVELTRDIAKGSRFGIRVAPMPQNRFCFTQPLRLQLTEVGRGHVANANGQEKPAAADPEKKPVYPTQTAHQGIFQWLQGAAQLQFDIR